MKHIFFKPSKSARDKHYRVKKAVQPVPKQNLRNVPYTPSTRRRPSAQAQAAARKKKRRQNNTILMGILCLVILFFIFVCYNISNSLKTKPDTQKADSPMEPNSSDASSVPVDPKKSIDLQAWNLLLVNSTNKITADFAPTTKKLANGKELDERIYDSTLRMIADAEKEDLHIIVCSSYRTFDYQTGLFKKQIKSVQNTQNCTPEEAAEIAGTVVAVPGTSEHQTGLALDLITRDYTSLDEGILNTPEVAWLYKNCQKYGFIVRFPKNSKNITGIIYEPWHYRYVGVEAATEIMQRDITLEEYIAEIQLAQGITPNATAK